MQAVARTLRLRRRRSGASRFFEGPGQIVQASSILEDKVYTCSLLLVTLVDIKDDLPATCG